MLLSSSMGNTQRQRIYTGSNDLPTSKAGGVLHILCVRVLVAYNGALASECVCVERALESESVNLGTE